VSGTSFFRNYETQARPGATLTINSDKTVIICDEGRLAEIRKQRQRLLGDEKPVPGRTVEVLAAASQEARSNANVDAGGFKEW
jgi:hypothetical protein